MKKFITVLGLAALTSMCLNAREVTTINDGWAFKSIQQKDWVPFQNVTLPHTWNAEYLDGTKSYNRETMSYRRDFVKTPDMQGKRVFLYFEGANSVATVFVNHKTVNEHLGGYTAFCYEITDFLKDGGNQIEVWVSNAFRSDVPPLIGDFNIYGGLHRPVHMIVTEQDCIDPTFFASPGVLISQNSISRDQADITVSTLVSNRSGRELLSKVSIYDADGTLVCSGSRPVSGNKVSIDFSIAKPHLWNGRKDPYLYKVVSELIADDGRVIDSVSQTTGFRSISADPDKGFFLNGEHYPLYGICRHEYFAGKGSALSHEDYELDMKLLLDLGATALRLAHYPHADYEFELCDANGLVLWSEIPMCGPGGYIYTGNIASKAFKDNTIQALKEMIYQKYNHPSACFWSLFNELLVGDRGYDDPEAFVAELNGIAKSIDSSRLTTYATAEGLSNFQNCADIIGINMYPGWYFFSEPVSLGENLDNDHRSHPDACLAISEYGAGASIHHHAFPDKENLDEACYTMVNPSGHWHPEEVQSTVIEDDWQAFGGREYLWGTFLWLFQDFKSDIRDEGDTWGMNDKGIVTEDRKVCKDAYYFLKAQWNPEPMVYITSRRWVERDWDQAYVKAYTNRKQATLYVNGEKIGTQKPDSLHRITWWDITLKEGENHIKVVAKTGRQELIDSCVWNYTPVPETEPFPEFGDPYAVTAGPHEHLLANYFGINAWSPDGRYVAVLETDLKERISEAGEYCTIGLVDLQDGNRFIPIAKTCTWNFQEAAMFHWLPDEEDTVIFNDMRDGKFVSVKLNWKTGKETIIPCPVSAVSADGQWAVSINYARLRLTRPDYGYAGKGQDALEDTQWPDNEGLWLVNLKTGKAKLIVDIASQKDNMTGISTANGLAYFCHTVFNKDASKIFWLARTVERDEQGNTWGVQTTAFTCNTDGTDVRRCFPDGWGGSHFNWKDDKTMVVTCNWENRLYGHVIFEVGDEQNVQHIGGGEIDWDGHCIFSPDGKFISTDGYFDDWNGFNRTWKIIRLSDGAVQLLGYYYVPEEYRNDWTRCDLHPRFRPDGRQIAFNSVHEGSRQVYIRDIQ